MEENKPDNPSAFPWVLEDRDGSCEVSMGMSLRDYFAAKAMPSVLRDYGGSIKEVHDLEDEALESVAFYSYQIADAMLKQRDK